MKKILLTIQIVVLSCMYIYAQDNIKRPDSYNYQSGVDAYYNEDYAKSMEFFDKEISQNPKNGYAMLWEAYIYENYNKYGQAMTSVNQAIKFIPKKDKEWVAMCYGLRGKVQTELGDTVSALSDYDIAIKTNTTSAEYIYNKCNLLHSQGRYTEIDAEIKRAMSIDKNSAVTWVYAGRNEDGKGNYDKALEDYNYAVLLDPKYSSAYSFRAATYINIHKYKEACQDVISALNAGSDTKAFFQLYELADSAGNYLSLQLKAQQLKDPNNSEWSYYLGIVKSHLEEYEDAEPAYREALRISEYEGQKSVSVYQNLAETLNELGKYSEAMDIIDMALSLDSTLIRSWRDKAEIYYNMGKNMPAIECIGKAIHIVPDNAVSYSTRARYYFYSKLFRNALDDINTAITLDSDESYYLIQRCEIYQKMGKNTEAVADCKAVISKETAKNTEDQNLQALAYAYARQGDKFDAIPVIEKVYKGREKKGSEYDLTCMYSLINDKDKALVHFENALKLGDRDFVHFNNDFDLDNIRSTEKFKKLITDYQNAYNEGMSTQNFSDDDYVENTTEIPFTKESGIYKVKCTINDLPLHFYFDTGASDVTLSSVEATFMLKNDYLKSSDIKGTSQYVDANGDVSEGTNIVLKKVSFGGLELNNVRASVVHNQKAPLLLGQTVLSRLGKIEIDYERNLLKITSKRRK